MHNWQFHLGRNRWVDFSKQLGNLAGLWTEEAGKNAVNTVNEKVGAVDKKLDQKVGAVDEKLGQKMEDVGQVVQNLTLLVQVLLKQTGITDIQGYASSLGLPASMFGRGQNKQPEATVGSSSQTRVDIANYVDAVAPTFNVPSKATYPLPKSHPQTEASCAVPRHTHWPRQAPQVLQAPQDSRPPGSTTSYAQMLARSISRPEAQ